MVFYIALYFLGECIFKYEDLNSVPYEVGQHQMLKNGRKT